MRTIRDNYYVITGHTYEEYIKKYRRKIGKGKLLSFSEDEVKFLKKNKHYWEVSDSDGKTLYCQVPKIKPKHIIIPLVIAALIGGGGAAAGIYLPKLLKKNNFDGTVTEAEWKNAIEDIVNVKENRDLQYSTSGTAHILEGNEELQFTDLKVSGGLEEAQYERFVEGSRTASGTIYMKNYYQCPLIHYNGDSIDKITSGRYMLKDYIALFLGDLYTQKTIFTFDKESEQYCYEYHADDEELTFKDITINIKFNDLKQISFIFCQYETLEKLNFACALNYIYEKPSLKDWDTLIPGFDKTAKQYVKSGKESVENNRIDFASLNNTYQKDTVMLFTTKDMISRQVDGMNKISLIDETTNISGNFKYFDIYINNTRLILGTDYVKCFENDVFVGFKLNSEHVVNHDVNITIKSAVYWSEDTWPFKSKYINVRLEKI